MNEIYNRDLVDKDRILNKKKSWRYCLALLFGMFLSVASFGQVSGYTFTQTSGTFTAVSGGTSLIAGGVDSGASPVTDIGFPFTFDGVSYTQFSASSNGWLRLGGTAASAYTSTPLSASGAGPAIAFMARDGKTNGAVVYTLTGTAPNRVLTVEYPNHYLQYNSLTNTLNAQIKLYETSNVVQIVYGYSAKATSYTGQVGLVGTANTNFATRTTTTNWSATTAGAANNSTMTWSSTVGPSDGLTYTWTQPTCFIPTLTATTAISETTATINWSAPSTAPSNGYNYEVRTSGAAGSGATGLVSSGAVAAGIVTKDITGLISATSYSVYVQSNCGSGDTSNWTAAGTFATTCTASSIPYTMPIEAVTVPALPLCTSVQNVNADAKTWVSYASITGITGKVMGYSYSGTVAANDWLFTNSLTLNAGTTYQVKFKYKDTGYVEKLKVGIGTSAVNSAMTTTLFDVSTGTSSAVVTQVINFTVPSSGTYTIGFQCYSAANQNVLYLGEISVVLAPSCIEPTALVASAVTANTAALSWTASTSSPSNGYDIYYSTTNTAPLAGTTPTVNNHTASPLNATGLTSASTYYWWVRSDCGAETSTWASGGSFTTTQIAATLPYTQDFSGANNFSFVNGAQINQWVNGSVAGNPGNSIYISNDAGVTNAYTTESTSVTQAYRDIAIPSGTTSASFSFDWNANGESTYDYLRVWLVPTSFVPVAGTQITAGTGRIQVGGNFNQQTTWQTYSNATLDLSSFANATMRLVFEWRNDSSGGTQTPAAVDNISLVIPSCVSPTALVSSAITSNTATLSWTASGSNPTNGYDIYYSTTNTAPLAGTTPTVDNHTASPFNAAGLTPASTYYWWVRSDCGVETSSWASGGIFTTLCDLVTTFSQNWDGVTATALPICFNKVGTLGTVNTQASNASSGTNTLYMYASSTSAEPTLALQPVSNAGAGTHWLKFKLRANNTVGGKLQVGYLTNIADATSFVMLQEFTASSLTYTEFTCSPGTVPGTNNTLALRAKGAPANSMLIDDLVWEAIPSCLSPTALVASAVTVNTATLSWTASTSSPTNGYDIYYSTTNTAPLAGTTPTVDNHTASPLNATGLTSASTYYWWVRSDCGAETSAWASGGSFTTLCNATNVPYAENFESAIVPALPNCTASQNVGTGNNWVTINNPGSGFTSNTLKYGYNSSDANAWFYTAGINLVAGKSYLVSYDYGNRSTYAEKMKVAVGTSAVNTAMTTELANYPNIVGAALQSANVTFTPSVSGVYYFGFNAYSIGGQWDLYLDNIKVEAACPTGVWVGTTSDWNTASNWADNMVPQACTNVTVNVAAPMIISSDVTVAKITLGASAVVTVGSTGVLNVGTISVATGGNLTINSDGVVLQSSTAANTAVATVKRNSTPLFRQDYTLWSSPVTGQNLRAFSTQTLFNRFSSYNTATNAYTQEIVTVADMDAKTFTSAKGYLIRMPNDWVELPSSNPAQPYSGSFTGTLNNGTITIPLLNETVDPGTPRKLNLVGNPYPSPISIAAFFAANTNIDQTLYFLRKKGTANLANTASSYAVLNGLGFTSADTDINGVPPTNIQTGQGFLVVANAGTPGNPTTLTFNNTMRTNGTPTFYKGATETNELHRLWLNLSNDSNVLGQTLIGYATGATQGVDSNFDALYFNDSDTALTSIINNSEYIIQGRALPFLTSDIVPLGFKTSAAGSFTITLSNFDGLFTGSQDVFLKDNSNNTVHNLKTAAYTFTSPVGVFNQRFEVQYEGALGTNNPSLTANDILIGVKNQQIKINAGTVTMKKVELIDISGRIIYTLEDVNATTTTIENMVISNQMLVVRITTADNAVVNQKIIF